uniref:WH2 domain-containing protein n=1 Tax=Panagrellus redivivus TaxID=6233 RepID=A0A7E4VZA6_PANRE
MDAVTVTPVPSTSTAPPPGGGRSKQNGAPSKPAKAGSKRVRAPGTGSASVKKVKSSNPMDAIFNEMNELESQKLKSKKKKESDDEASEPPPHAGTPIPGAFRAPNFVDLMRIESDNSMIFEFLQRRTPSVCEMVLAYKMLRGRVDAFSGVYFDRTKITELQYHIPPDEELLRELALPDVYTEQRRGPRTPSEPPPSPGLVSEHTANTATDGSVIPPPAAVDAGLQIYSDADQSAEAREARIAEIKRHMARRLKKSIEEVSALISEEHWHLVAAIKKEDMVSMIDKMVLDVKRADNLNRDDSDSLHRSRNSIDMEISDDESTSPPTRTHLPSSSIPANLPFVPMPLAPIPQSYPTYANIPKPIYRPDPSASTSGFGFQQAPATQSYSTPSLMPPVSSYPAPPPVPTASSSFTNVPPPPIPDSSATRATPSLPGPSTSFTPLPNTAVPPPVSPYSGTSATLAPPASQPRHLSPVRPQMSTSFTPLPSTSTTVSHRPPFVSPPPQPTRPLVPPRLFSIPPPPLPARHEMPVFPPPQNGNNFRNGTPRRLPLRPQIRGGDKRNKRDRRNDSNDPRSIRRPGSRDRRSGSGSRHGSRPSSRGRMDVASNDRQQPPRFDNNRRSGPPQWRPDFSQTPVERPVMPPVVNTPRPPASEVITPSSSSVMRTLFNVLQPPQTPPKAPTQQPLNPMPPRGFPRPHNSPGMFPRPSFQTPQRLPSLMGNLVPPPRFTPRPRRQRF